MTQYQFTTQMTRMITTYGDKAYPKARMDLLWSLVKDCDAFNFQKFIDESILVHKFAPMAEQFREFVDKDKFLRLQTERAETLRRLNNGLGCQLCGDDGRILARQRTTGYLFTFLCSACSMAATNGHINTNIAENGQPRQGLVKWDYSYTDRYELISPAPKIKAALDAELGKT